MTADPGTPRPAAVMKPCPGPLLLTRPAVSTVATLASDETHRNGTPCTMAPEESFATAARRCVSPTAVTPAEGGEMTTWATTWATAMVAWPATLPTCAEMTAVPFVTAVASPVALSTVATAVFDDRHTTVADTGDPPASTGC